MPVNRIQAGGTAPSPDRPDFNIVGGTGITVAASDDATNLVSKATITNAGLATGLSNFPVKLSAVTSGAVVARFVAQYSGTIVKLDAHVWDPVTTTAKSATFQAAISGVSTGGGAVAVTSTLAATLGAMITGSAVTSANSFSPGQVITVTAAPVTQFVEGQIVLDMFVGPA